MSPIPSPLRVAARSAYRNLYRASASTFAGDTELLRAFRVKMRRDALQSKDLRDPKAYEESIRLSNEIATLLRRNLVQAERQAEDRYKIRITKHTELGSNDSIKNPPPLESSRSARKRANSPYEHTLQPSCNPHLNYSQLKRAHSNREIPLLNETDLDESFVRGSGPGGQSINKTNNNVQLRHIPTGIRINCQETRSLEQNRKLARRILLDKLDRLLNPGLSKQDLKRAREHERDRRRRKKARKATK